MKSVMLFVVSMVFLFGCSNPVENAVDSLGKGGSGYLPYVYVAKVKVSTYSGEPCSTAIIIISPNTFHADTAGVIRPSYRSVSKDTIQYFLTTVYKYNSEDSPSRLGTIPFKREDFGAPELFDIKFPDSP